MSSPLLPTFFILGAGRCGTTSLAEHLRRHADIFIPDIKEPSFFASSFRWVNDPAHYVKLYADARGATQLGDASHIYLEDPESPEILRAFFPDARFILVFRNPADRALALYAWMVERGYELKSTFEDALAAEDRRFESARFRRTCPQSFWNYMYFRSGLFGEQVARYLQYWPRENFYATTLYEYLHDPDRITSDIASFLGLEHLHLGPVPHQGASRGTRSRPVQYVERTVLQPLADRNVPPGVGRIRASVSAWNRTADRPQMRPDTRETLLRRFEPDLAHLNDLLGVDVLGQEAAARSR